MRWTDRRSVASIGLGLSVAVGTWLVLGFGPTFKAHAIVGMSDAFYADLAAPSREAAVQGGAAAVLSRSVLARAANGLRDKAAAKSDPGLAERLSVAAGLGEATGRNERLEQALAAVVTATRGPALGTIAISASDPTPERAAAIATAVAEAFIIDQDEAALELRRAGELAERSRLDTLLAAADAAHRRLASFGVVAATDPERDKAAAAAETAAAKTRLEAFRAVIASGAPPLGAQTGLPDSIAPLQADYLDLKRQLVGSRRTLGDRHTTVIGLEDGLRQAAKALTVEWKRLEKAADIEFGAARDREAALTRLEASRDPKSRQTIDDARQAARTADDAVARFKASRASLASDDRRYRLIATAAAPAMPNTMPIGLRLVLAGLLGLTASAALLLPNWRFGRMRSAPRGGRDEPTAPAEASDTAADTPAPYNPAPDTLVPDTVVPTVDPLPIVVDAAPEPILERAARLDWPVRPNRGPMTSPRPPRGPVAAPAREPMPLAFDDMADEVSRVRSAPGLIPTVVLGSTDTAGTTPLALDLARAVAASGQRVLLIEHERTKPTLAASAALEGQPILVDVLGTLKIALIDDVADGLYLAPAFEDARRLAAGLARRDDVPLIDDPASEFDLVLIDAGWIDTAAPVDWSGIVDASIRIGRFASKRDDETFLTAIGGTFATFIGTVAASASPARGGRREREEPVDIEVDAPIVPPPSQGARPARAAASVRLASRPPVAARPTVRRKIAAR